jgi:hypothetical protein
VTAIPEPDTQDRLRSAIRLITAALDGEWDVVTAVIAAQAILNRAIDAELDALEIYPILGPFHDGGPA